MVCFLIDFRFVSSGAVILPGWVESRSQRPQRGRPRPHDHHIPEPISFAPKGGYQPGTDLPVGPDNVAELAAGGRARWKIENETFNVLKTKGYNIEHNFGHGKRHLAAILVTLNLLAFAIHTVCDIADELWRAAAPW
jgi:hypothetical protein